MGLDDTDTTAREQSQAVLPEGGRGFLIGLVGEGIGRSLTPAMHMVEGDAQGMRYLYRLIDLTTIAGGAARLPEILAMAIALGFDGLNITHPCKQAVIPLLDEIDEAAARIGAVNTVRIRDGRTKGFNTDVSGFAAGLSRNLGDIADARVVQIGAGGAGSATADAVLTMGAARLDIVDADAERARGLARTLATRFGEGRIGVATDAAAVLPAADGLVHATPTGMAAHPGIAIDSALLRPGLWVAEIVYFPLETALLRAARDAGCRTVHGGYMAVFQAVGAFDIFTGARADAERMMAHFARLTDGAA